MYLQYGSPFAYVLFQRNCQKIFEIAVILIQYKDLVPCTRFLRGKGKDQGWLLLLCGNSTEESFFLLAVSCAERKQDNQMCADRTVCVPHWYLQEYFQVQPSIFLWWEHIVKVCGVAHSVQPQANINTIWQTMNRMKQNFPSLLSDVPDGSFGPSVLEMGVDSTVSDELLVCGTVFDESVVGKLAVVRLILQNFHGVPGGKLLKGLLGLNCLIGQERLL